MEVKCPTGTILSTDKAVMGVISNEFASFTYCIQSAINPELELHKHQNCTANMNGNTVNTIRKELKRKCSKKGKCNLSFENVISAKTPAVRKACDDESYLFL